MTKEEFVKKYTFAVNMQSEDLKTLVMFIMMSLLDITLKVKGDQSKIETFLEDVKSFIV